MNHGIRELILSKNCPHQYLVAFKKHTNEIYVAFCGTDGWEAIYSDLNILPIPNEFQGRFHAGFYQRSKLIPLEPFIDLLNKHEDFKLIFTGHSLGGAIAATLTARMLFDEKATNLKPRIHCVAFGSPSICDDDCSKYINEHYRTHFHFFINRNDVVPIILSSFSKFLSDKLSSVRLWFEKVVEILKGEVQKEEMRSRSSVSNDTSSSIVNDVSQSKISHGFVTSYLDATVSLRYAPFGLQFHTVSNPSSIDSRNEYVVLLTETDLQNVYDRLYDSRAHTIDWSSLLTRYQNHSINNYRIEIYDRVINAHRLTSDGNLHVGVEPVKKSVSTTALLHHFVLPEKTSWTAYNRKKQKSDYIWSIERDTRERANEETITLQLEGSAVSFITGVICEESEYAQNPVGPDVTASQKSLKVFVMKLPLRRNPTVDHYPFLFITHFGVVKLEGLFNPKFFVSRTGLEGRKRQVAELVIMDLYKLAFSYSTFTGPTITEHANESLDAKRRRYVKEYLLLCEKLFQEEFKQIEDSFEKQDSEVVKKVMEEISYVHTERIQRQYVLSRSDYPTKTHTEETSFPSTPFKLAKLQDIMIEWQNRTSSKDDLGLATTEVIKKVIPTLVAIMLSISLKYDSVVGKWIVSGGYITGGLMALFSAIISLSAVSISIGMIVGGVIGGVINGVSAYIYEFMREVQKEYSNILMLVAQSLGVAMKQIVEHPYCLEKEISLVYSNKFEACADNVQHILNNWKHFFPYKPFKSLRENETRIHYINLVKCINAHFHMRQLLSQDFAVGVVGPGRTGKSKLIQQMFNFNTRSGKERTVDMHSYRVSDEFRIVDFPHSTSTKDPLRSNYLCHHTLVNAVIVVLDARKLGDENGEKDVINMVKVLANEGVDVLYCFNIADQLVKTREEDDVESSEMNRFEMAEKALNDAITTDQPVTHEFKTCWTKEKVSESLATFARNYDVNVEDCVLSFFELDVPKDQFNLTYSELDKLGIKNPNYIKKVWLTKVLESNSLSEESIEKVMKFWNKKK